MTLFELLNKEAPDKVRYYTTELACKILRCNPSTLSKWKNQGFISCKKWGKRNMFPEHEVLAIAQWRFNGRMESIKKRMNRDQRQRLGSVLDSESEK